MQVEPNTGKRRLLMLLRLLLEQTDEEHPLSTAEIVAYFHKRGAHIERRTVKTDIDLLREAGHDVVTTRGTQNKYFIGSRIFELPELKLLMDAVYASRFITPAKSAGLIRKLSSFASEYQANRLQNRLYISQRIKPVNEKVYYTADIIRMAIEKQRQIIFQYYEYTPDKQRVLKHGGQVYHFSPYDLIWNEDRYYALGFSASHGKVISFRVDRMCNAELSEEAAIPAPEDYSVSAYGKKIFDMFPGREMSVTLKCANHLMRVIVDRFGEEVHTEVSDEDHFLATADVSVSPTFYGWVFQFGGEIRIVSPPDAVREYEEMCKR